MNKLFHLLSWATTLVLLTSCITAQTTPTPISKTSPTLEEVTPSPIKAEATYPANFSLEECAKTLPMDWTNWDITSQTADEIRYGPGCHPRCEPGMIMWNCYGYYEELIVKRTGGSCELIKLGNIAWDIEVECPVTPIDATATALACTQALEAQEAAAEAVVPSMAGESAVVTTVPVRWVHPAKIYFDQERLWFYDGNKLIALDPESKKVVVGPVALGSDLESMVFNGKQLWILQYQGDLPIRLRPLNVESGKLGPAIEIGSASEGLSFLGDLVYDGRLLWFWTGMGSKAVDSPKRRELQSIDPSLLRLLPPVEIKTEEQINLVVDQARQVLWIITDDGQVQQFDLQQNVLRPTTMQFMHDVGYMNFDGQRLWTISSKMGQDPLVQSLDVDTGETTVLPLPPSGGRRPVLVDNQIWFGTNDFTIQPIDLADGQLGPAIPVYGKPIDLEFDGQRLWILQQVQDCDGQDYLLLQYLVPTD